MIKAKVSKTFNLKKIKLDLSDELNDGIKVISKDIEYGIDKGVQFNKPFKRNAPSTIKKKGFDKPLEETGLMKDASKMIVSKATTKKQESSLLPNSKRIKIASYNQEDREFWGISDNAERKVITMVKNKIRKNIKKSHSHPLFVG